MKNFLITTPVILGVLWAGYLLLKDFRQSNVGEELNLNREVIGQIMYLENNVKRQFGGDLMWNSVENKEPLYNQDSVRTGKDSQVAIKLVDNTVLEVSENSLIVLDKSQNNMNINFKAGDLSAKNAGSNVSIKVKDGLVKGFGADFKIKTDSESGAKIEVTKGKATIEDKNNKKTNLNENEETLLDEKGAGDIIKIAVILKSPEDKAQINSNLDSVKHPFTWEVINKKVIQEYFEISKNKNFLKDKTKTFKAHQAITAEAASGSNYWRVGWDDSKKGRQYTESRLFVVGADKRLELIYPEDGTSFQFEPDENNLELQWHSLITAKAFTLEVAKTSDFKVIANSQIIKGQEGELKVLLKNLESGKYYWRVKAFGEKNDLLATSAVNDFTIKLKLPTLPELLRPNQDFTWTDSSAIPFSWKKLENATLYRLIISSDQEQKSIVKSISTKETTYTWPNKVQQVVYWSVMALGNQSKIIAHSELRKLTIQTKKKSSPFELVKPKDQTEVQRDLSQKTVDPVLFQWKILRPLPGTVTLIIANNDEFLNPIKINNLKKFSHDLVLDKEGSYYWKLESTSEKQKDYIEISETNTFNLRHVSLIPAPSLISPEMGEKIETTEAITVKFSWKESVGAVQYHIVVEKVDPKTNDRKTVMDKLIKETIITSQPLPEGQYQWSVSSFDQQGQEGMASRLYDFSIIPVDEVAAPQLNNPVVK
ncbi:MAG: FecR domain-containing protein [Oligoflexia bacterium]|nr:FecR domain-containing protein [Oligoflexia bacterium]